MTDPGPPLTALPSPPALPDPPPAGSAAPAPPSPAPPPPSPESELVKTRYQAELDAIKAQYLAQLTEVSARFRDEATRTTAAIGLETQRQDTAQTNADTLRNAVHGAYVDLAKSGVDRMMQRATFLTTVTASVGTIYTGLLALVYSVSSGVSRPLPARGVVPGLFLAAALCFSAYYIDFIRASRSSSELLPAGAAGDIDERRLATFLDWAIAPTVRRAWALRAAVVSLGLGVIALPFPFVSIGTWWTVGLTLTMAGVLVLWLICDRDTGLARRLGLARPS